MIFMHIIFQEESNALQDGLSVAKDTNHTRVTSNKIIFIYISGRRPLIN